MNSAFAEIIERLRKLEERIGGGVAGEGEGSTIGDQRNVAEHSSDLLRRLHELEVLIGTRLRESFVASIGHDVATRARNLLVFPLAPILAVFAFAGLKGCDLVNKAEAAVLQSQKELTAVETVRGAISSKMAEHDARAAENVTMLTRAREQAQQASEEATQLLEDVKARIEQAPENYDQVLRNAVAEARAELRSLLEKLVQGGAIAAESAAPTLQQLSEVPPEVVAPSVTGREYEAASVGWFFAGPTLDGKLTEWNVTVNGERPREIKQGETVQVLAAMNLRADAPKVMRRSRFDFGRIVAGLPRGSQVEALEVKVVQQPGASHGQMWIKVELPGGEE